MIPETLLRALQLIYEGRYGGEWEVTATGGKKKNEPKT